MAEERYDVVVVGAGLAGLTAAYTLRESRVLTLEREDWVGGRTRSGQWGDLWYNIGAQFLHDPRTMELVRRFGLPHVSTAGARSALFIKGKLVKARTPLEQFLRMPLSLGARVDLVRMYLKVRPLLARYPDRVDRHRLDDVSFAELVGRVHPDVRALADALTGTTAGFPAAQTSAYIALPYALGTHDLTAPLTVLVNGTQQLALAMERVPGMEVRRGATVSRVANENGGVVVEYRMGGRKQIARGGAAVVTAPAPVALQVVEGIEGEKRRALEAIRYTPLTTVALRLSRPGPAPFDDVHYLAAFDTAFDALSNNGLYARRHHGPGVGGDLLLTLCYGARAEALAEAPDEEVIRTMVRDVYRVFPQVQGRFAEGVVQRWAFGLPRFAPGGLRRQAAVRAPVGPVYFAGDYTNAPGTEGAVNSGYRVAQAVARELGLPADTLVR